MKENNRAVILFQKYIDRTASAEELDEMFRIFEDSSQFESVSELFDREWESNDVSFDLDTLTFEKFKEEYDKRRRDENNFLKYSSAGWVRWSAGIAASLFILIGVSIWYFNTGAEVVYETGYGETMEITLDDDSRVKLNANSRLVWNTEWESSGVRVVTLEGEAFFTVKEISSSSTDRMENRSDFMPFQVITQDLTVNVLGTTFNVMSRRQRTDVYLASGKVILELNEKGKDLDLSETFVKRQKVKESSSQTIVMKPGDEVSYSATKHILDQINNSTIKEEASWIEGTLSFDNEQLKVVLQQLEDIYGKQFEVKDTALLNRKVNLGLPYEDWNTVSELMTIALEIKMTQENGKIIIE